MDTATKLIVEWSDHKRNSIAGRFKYPVDLHQVADYLVKRLGKRPAMITIIDRVAIATY